MIGQGHQCPNCAASLLPGEHHKTKKECDAHREEMYAPIQAALDRAKKDSKNITVDIIGCARCHGDGHKGLSFKPLTHPVTENDRTLFTHWTTCPTTYEPILMSVDVDC